MLFFSLFLAGFTLGIFVSLKIFAPERQEETWDPQHFPNLRKSADNSILMETRISTSVGSPVPHVKTGAT